MFKEVLQDAGTSISVGNAGVNILMKTSLNQLWSALNNQQIIVLLPLLKLNFPTNVTVINAVLVEIAGFELFDMTEFKEELYGDMIDEDDEVNQPYND